MVYRCDCGNVAKFFVHQATIPQQLANGEMETAPAGRSILVCGNHLAQSVIELGSLPFRTNESVRVTLQRSVISGRN